MSMLLERFAGRRGGLTETDREKGGFVVRALQHLVAHLGVRSVKHLVPVPIERGCGSVSYQDFRNHRLSPLLVVTGIVLLSGVPGIGVMSIAQAQSFVASSTSQSFTANSREPSEPSGAQEGDFILAVCSAATSGTWTDPADFTQITQKQATGEGSARNTYLGYKIRGANAGSGYAFSHNGTSAEIRCTLNAYRGFDQFDVAYVEGSHYGEHTDGPNEANPAITTVTDGAWVVLVQVLVGDAATAAEPPSNYTERSDYRPNPPEHYIATRAITTAGTETPGEFSRTDAPFADTQNFTLALRVTGASVGGGGSHPFRGPFGGPF